MSMKNSSDTIGNRTRDLLTCSAVPQPTALRRARIVGLYTGILCVCVCVDKMPGFYSVNAASTYSDHCVDKKDKK